MSSHPRRSSANKRIQEWQRVSDERDGTVEPEPRPMPQPKAKAKRKPKAKAKRRSPERAAPAPEPPAAAEDAGEDHHDAHDAALAAKLSERMAREQALIQIALDYTIAMDASDRRPTDERLMHRAIAIEKELRRLGRLFNTSAAKTDRIARGR